MIILYRPQVEEKNVSPSYLLPISQPGFVLVWPFPEKDTDTWYRHVAHNIHVLTLNLCLADIQNQKSCYIIPSIITLSRPEAFSATDVHQHM